MAEPCDWHSLMKKIPGRILMCVETGAETVALCCTRGLPPCNLKVMDSNIKKKTYGSLERSKMSGSLCVCARFYQIRGVKELV